MSAAGSSQSGGRSGIRSSTSSKLLIHARHSDLARLQAYRVGAAIEAAAAIEKRGVKVEYGFRASLGDLNQTDPLWKMPEKGVFTEDFRADLLSGAADMVVHSWKDLPTAERDGTEIVATLPRADARDVLLFRHDRIKAASDSGRVRVLTSSPRRAHNLDGFLRSHLPFRIQDLEFQSVRGNIPTRLKKLLSQDVDALIVAKAALDRLLTAPEPEFATTAEDIRSVLKQTRWMILPLSVNPAAAAQGALAIEIASGNTRARAALTSIHCAITFAAVRREREILSSYGGGCHQKIGVTVLQRSYGRLLFLKGLTDQGEVLDRIELTPSRPVISAAHPAAVFPQAGEEANFFSRQDLPRQAWQAAETAPLLWVARESAWPESLRASSQAVVWVAGLKTWRKLAQRGVWVTGSAESLGEEEDPRIQHFLAAIGMNVSTWLKLTHEASAGTSGTLNTVGTYRLLPLATAPELRDRTHFYWMSGSSFDRALALYPEIRNRHHASGPGLTHRHIAEILGPPAQSDARLSVHLDIESWRRAILPPVTQS